MEVKNESRPCEDQRTDIVANNTFGEVKITWKPHRESIQSKARLKIHSDEPDEQST
jgi:hypothetical protein